MSVFLNFKITPNAKQTVFSEWIVDEHGTPVLKVKLAAPPVDGKANKALIAFLAKSLGFTKSEISIKRGGKNRSKVLEFRACEDEAALRERIDALI